MGNCSSVAFGLIRTECESTNKILSIDERVIENVTRTMSSTRNQVVTQLNVSQTITIEADVISCTNLNVGNRVSVDVVVNQEINEVARSQLLTAIDSVTEWDAVQENREVTGWFSNPAAGQVNDVQVVNYFKSLTEQTLTLELLNSITNSMYIDQNIVIRVRELSGTNCNITNDVMVKIFVTQALYAVLDAFQNSTYDLETNLKLKQSLERENRGIFESFFGSKKGKFVAIAAVIGLVAVIGIVILVVITSGKKKGGGSTTVITSPQPAPIPINGTVNGSRGGNINGIPRPVNGGSSSVNGSRSGSVNGSGSSSINGGGSSSINGSSNGNVTVKYTPNGTTVIEIPTEMIPNGLFSNGNGNRVSGRSHMQNSRQPT